MDTSFDTNNARNSKPTVAVSPKDSGKRDQGWSSITLPRGPLSSRLFPRSMAFFRLMYQIIFRLNALVNMSAAPGSGIRIHRAAGGFVFEASPQDGNSTEYPYKWRKYCLDGEEGWIYIRSSLFYYPATGTGAPDIARGGIEPHTIYGAPPA